jgi:hypothetical protein
MTKRAALQPDFDVGCVYTREPVFAGAPAGAALNRKGFP